MTETRTVAPLRFGLLLDAAEVNAWQASVLDNLVDSGDAELALLVIGSGKRQGARLGQTRVMRRGSMSQRLGAIAFTAFSTRLSRSRALRSAGTPWSPDVPVVRVTPVSVKPARVALRANDVDAIKAYDLDFLVRFGLGVLTGDVLEAARLGVWSFHHGDELAYRGQPAGFWEIIEGQPAVGAVLQRLTERLDGGVVLRKGWFATAPESYALTRDRVLLGAAAWPARVARAIRQGVILADEPPSPTTAALRTTPDIGSFLRFLSISARARLRKLWHHGMRHDDWNIGIVDVPLATVLKDRSIPAVRWAPERRGHYAADPFGAPDGAAVEVFYEDYVHAVGKASIARRRWSAERGWATPETVLDIGTHLSYPLVFEHAGRRLMLPESRASGRLVLYEADPTDGRWRSIADLGLGEDVADSTIFEHDGRWWLFAVRADRLNPATDLYLWFADRPEGPWQTHPLNPIVVDVRSARPAGPLFQVDGQLYRPGQDCSTGYGDRLAIKRVVTLTTERFQETDEFVLEPERDGPFSYGLHTLTGVGDVTLVDGRRWVRDTRATINAVRRRLPI